jgi:hypothetical protein
MEWKIGKHAEVPPDAGLVLGDPNSSNVQWLDMGATSAPVNIDVPVVSQTGANLNCTMGNWDHEPTSYAYQWKSGGTDIGTDAPVYAVQAGDVGNSFTCVVTATNAIGSTAAPPSNAVIAT